MPKEVRYLTQLNTKPRIFKWYTPGELITILILSFIPFVGEIVLGLTPNIFLVALIWIVLTFIIVLFRIGKPEGYLVHLLYSLYLPDSFRIGGTEHEGMKYPIAKPYEDRK